MIFDSLKNKDNYRDFPLLYEALCYLSTLKEGELPPANTVLKEGILFCNPVSLTTKPEEQCIYEAHRRYIDLHYTVSGTERIATAGTDSLTVSTPYDQQKTLDFSQEKRTAVTTSNQDSFLYAFQMMPTKLP